MNFNLRNEKIRIIEPFALFVIVVGVGINVIVPLFVASTKTNGATREYATKAMWGFAVVCGLIYTLVFLRYLFKNSGLDRLLYFIMVAIFVLLAAFTFYLP